MRLYIVYSPASYILHMTKELLGYVQALRTPLAAMQLQVFIEEVWATIMDILRTGVNWTNVFRVYHSIFEKTVALVMEHRINFKIPLYYTYV